MWVRVKYAAVERRFQHKTGDSARNQGSAAFRQIGNFRTFRSFNTLLHEDTILGVLRDYSGNCNPCSFAKTPRKNFPFAASRL